MSLVRALNPRTGLTPDGYHNRPGMRRSGLDSSGLERI